MLLPPLLPPLLLPLLLQETGGVGWWLAARQGRGSIQSRQPTHTQNCPAHAFPRCAQDGKALPDKEARRLISEEGRKPFDMSRAPLLAVAVARVSPTFNLLLITLHHTIVDGWSLGRVLPDMLEFYHSLVQQRPSVLTALSLQYSDFSAWEQVGGWVGTSMYQRA